MQLGAVSGFLVLPQLGSVLIFVAPVTIEGHADSWGLDHHLGPCLSGWPLLLPGVTVTSRPQLLLRTLSESVVLLQSGSELTSKLLLPRRAVWMPRDRSVTRVHVGVGWPCCTQSRSDPCDLHCYPMPW